MLTYICLWIAALIAILIVLEIDLDPECDIKEEWHPGRRDHTRE